MSIPWSSTQVHDKDEHQSLLFVSVAGSDSASNRYNIEDVIYQSVTDHPKYLSAWLVTMSAECNCGVARPLDQNNPAKECVLSEWLGLDKSARTGIYSRTKYTASTFKRGLATPSAFLSLTVNPCRIYWVLFLSLLHCPSAMHSDPSPLFCVQLNSASGVNEWLGQCSAHEATRLVWQDLQLPSL